MRTLILIFLGGTAAAAERDLFRLAPLGERSKAAGTTP